MFNSDRPIENASEDLLSRANFASTLTRSLLDYKEVSPLTIGLFGPWGSGKTSLVNLIINDIYVDSEKLAEADRPIILRFNPWNFTSTEQLLQQYFRMLADLFTGNGDKGLAAIGSLLSTYGEGFEVIPYLGKAVEKGTELIGSQLQQHTLHGADISKQRKDIIEKLQKLHRKIIITIDDIDRLTNEEIQLIFKLISSVANFPNTIFLLSFDKDIVANALKGFQGDDGNKYLEKIIQVSVAVPPASRAQLQDIFAKYFDPLIDHNHSPYPNMVFEQQYWSEISNHVFAMISNVRDIVRLYNAVLLKLNMVGDEINFSDIVMITLLELKHPAFYEWIRNHKVDLTQSTGYLVYSVKHGNTSSEQLEKIFLEEFKKLNLTISADECNEILSMMFPIYGKAVNSRGYYDDNRLIREQRIGQQYKFARYFILSIGDNKIPRSMVNNAVSSYSVEELMNFIKKSVENHNSGDLITEIDASLKDVDNKRKKVVLEALIPSIKYLNDPIPGEGYYLSAKGRAEYLNIIIMKDLGTDSSYQIMQGAIEGAEVGDLEALSYILDVMLISYNRIRQNNGFPKVVTEQQLDKLGEAYIKKTLEIDKENNLLSLKYSLCYFIFQYFNDGKDYNQYITDKISDNDLNKLLYLSQTMDMWSGTGGNDYRDSQYAEREKFISDDELTKVIKEAVKSGLIKALNENQALKIAAYYIYHTEEAVERVVGVNEEECREKLNEWGYYEIDDDHTNSREVEYAD